VLSHEASWDSTFQGTPLRRARRAGIARNAVVVALNKLRAGAEGEEADVARRAIEAAQSDADPRVRQIAIEAADTLKADRSA